MKRVSSGGSSTKSPRSRRDWIKNAVIIFLAVMLVLTFFSNTIMNWSLPEVAAQYPQSTTITTKIRGSGTVAATKTYNVTVQEARTVGQVQVKPGDTVKAGDTLVTLDQQESQELQDARTNLAALDTEYKKMLVSKGDQNHAANASIQQLRQAVAQAEADLQDAKNYESSLTWYQQQVSSAQSGVTSAQQTLSAINTEIALLQNQKDSVKVSSADYLAAEQKVTDAQRAVDQLKAQEPPYSEPAASPAASAQESAESPAHQAWQTSLDAAQAALDQAAAGRDQLYAALTLELDQKLADANQRRIYAEAGVSTAQSYLDDANNALSGFQNEHPGSTTVDAAQSALQSAQQALSSAEAAAADQAAASAYDGSVAQIDQTAKAQGLQKARDLVAELEAKAGPATIVSRYPGVVQTVNVAAGDKTDPETPLMVIELTEAGYTLTATVTKDQARLLREGTAAEITNLWDSGITMTLSSITTDKQNPASSRVLTFTVQGEDVTVGQTLNFSIGDKNASYDVVIPSSAVHTDADGSFVYTVTVKSSPLGNRYTVRRTAVEVLASDDTQSAVSGSLSTADFVITTATVPLKAGDQVRIAE